MSDKCFPNPFRPGAGHPPPFLAGRDAEKAEFKKLLKQEVILENMVLTGLRGTGKTVLLDTFKPMALSEEWMWAGTDLSESASISEENIAHRLLTDLAIVTSSVIISNVSKQGIGFSKEEEVIDIPLNYGLLTNIYNDTPGLVSDKLKQTLEFAWKHLQNCNINGLVFAYDEAQNLSDQAAKEEYPCSLLLDVFQSLQKKGYPFLLVLTGLPTLFPKLVKARTYAERMFHVIELDRLDKGACKEAIIKPVENSGCPLILNDEAVETIYRLSGGYPYFIQFICREVYDAFIQKHNDGEPASVPVEEIIQKLDADFFSGRWARATDRQRELLSLIASLENCDSEFSVAQISEISETMSYKPFSSSNTLQMFNTLIDAGLLFKNRHGRYSFAVPLLGEFIKRQATPDMFLD